MLPDFLLFLDGFSGGGTEPTLARILGHHYMRLPGAVSELMGGETPCFIDTHNAN
jgi:hypothetical protein